MENGGPKRRSRELSKQSTSRKHFLQLWVALQFNCNGGSFRDLVRMADGAWSSDEKKLVFANVNDLYLANGDGTESHKLASLPGFAFGSAWSPDGSLIRFTVSDPKTRVNSLWQVSVDGSNLRLLLPGWHQASGQCCGNWTPDGTYF